MPVLAASCRSAAATGRLPWRSQWRVATPSSRGQCRSQPPPADCHDAQPARAAALSWLALPRRSLWPGDPVAQTHPLFSFDLACPPHSRPGATSGRKGRYQCSLVTSSPRPSHRQTSTTNRVYGMTERLVRRADVNAYRLPGRIVLREGRIFSHVGGKVPSGLGQRGRPACAPGVAAVLARKPSGLSPRRASLVLGKDGARKLEDLLGDDGAQ
jgi:hypothetical protein